MSPDRPEPVQIGDNNLYPLPLAGGGWLLIDAGPDIAADETVPTAASWERVQAQLHERGIDRDDVRIVLLTHGHIDHAGLAARWAGLGARILVGAGDRDAATGGRRWLDERRPRRAAELMRHGFPPPLRDLLDVWGRASLAAWRWEPCPEAAIEVVADGATFPLAGADGAAGSGDGVLRIIAAPGHTPGNLVAIEGATLYSGDTLLPTTVPTPGLHFPDGSGARWPSLPRFIESVERLSQMGIGHVRPGHGGAGDPGPLFERFARHHERRQRRVLAALRDGDPAGLSAYDVALALFPHLPPERTTQAMTELIGHLDILVERGLVERGVVERGAVEHQTDNGTTAIIRHTLTP